MHKAKRYTISFLPQDTELIKHVEDIKRKQSLSSYIRTLIRRDIEGKNEFDLEEVYKLVIKKLREDGVGVVGTASENGESHLDEEDKDLILELF